MIGRSRRIIGLDGGQTEVDVYAVLEAFAVTCPARQRAIRKLLCAGLRGNGNALHDLSEASLWVQRAYGLESNRKRAAEAPDGP